MTTIEGNKLIAEFMGYYVTEFNGMYHFVRKEKKKPEHLNQVWEFRLEESKYHESWDWLMPVVEKIESLRFNGKEDEDDVEWQFSVEIKNGGCVIHRDVLPQYHGTTEDFLKLYDCDKTDKLKSTYEAVTQFIQWYKTLNP